jgi:hypothetical protein
MADPRSTAAKLGARLRASLGDELRSVVLFGSVPRGEAIPGVSDLNLLALLQSVRADTLIRIAPVVQQWIRAGNTPPHVYSVEEWDGMADTFAIEIADMQDAREVLWGTDPIVGGTPAAAHLRTQAERESRETVMHLRLRLMLSAGSPSEIGILLLSGLPSFTAYLRSVLRLLGEPAGMDTTAVIQRAGAVLDSDPAPMLHCWQARRAQLALEVPIGDPLVTQYTDFANDLIRYLDRMPTARATVETRRTSATSAEHS